MYQPPNPSVVAAVEQLPIPTPAARKKAYEEGDILFFGRLVFEKGADDLIRGFALARDRGVFASSRAPALVIHGEGPERPALQSLVRDLGLGGCVQFHPFLKGDDLVPRARAASLVVFPSRWEEPGGTLAVELFMMGASVLSSRQGASGEIFEGHGRLFDNRNVEALAGGLAAHFREGPVYPNPTGNEPWALPNIRQVATSLVESELPRS
jgi:glycosyltransferase involved in cell wall biosynthesis